MKYKGPTKTTNRHQKSTNCTGSYILYRPQYSNGGMFVQGAYSVFFIAIYPKGCNISLMNNMKTERKKQNNEKQCGELPKPS